jgi:hypothetical protein
LTSGCFLTPLIEAGAKIGDELRPLPRYQVERIEDVLEVLRIKPVGLGHGSV